MQEDSTDLWNCKLCPSVPAHFHLHPPNLYYLLLLTQRPKPDSIHTLPTAPPLLPIPTPQHLLPILQTYTSPTPLGPPTPPVPPLALLPHVTSTAPARPLSTHTTNVLSDLCHSLREVARLAETEVGRGVLGEWLGEEEGKWVAEFWEGEWIVE